ncbi:probable inactive receptor-like protein kinase At3g56050 [Chenopodium quinoa]|uniref:probable inactive receptor-like protein kinase At3g56050 n=1 Tax=Chenopodium quinoa TaxID=63459 RepID=UPI000B77E49E|nr:probable inactive receptor-like protein kinase At3g56050 [Chenopodium quinoa]
MKSNLWVFYGVNLVFLFHLQLLLLPCSSLNSEGLALLKFKEKVVRDPFNALSNWSDKDGDLDHCSWFGVSCSEGNVVILNLKDLCLGGTLASELGNLYHIKSIILRNNSFDGIIASEIADLKELEMLDLGYNNFSGPIPSNLGNNFSLSILLLDNNNNLGSLSPELNQLQMQSEHQVDEEYLRTVSARASCNSKSFSWYTTRPDNFVGRSLLQVPGFPFRRLRDRRPASPTPSTHAPSPSKSHSDSPSPSRSPISPSSPSPSPSRAISSPVPAPAPVIADPPSPTPSNPPVVSVSPAAQAAQVPDNTKRSGSKQHKVIILASVAGGLTLLIISAAAIIVCRSSKIGTVKPWATGLSGQLQRAFVSGVPKLKRAELETACEDFSNIIGTLNDGTVYKGTLSSGIEIAVVATSVKSSEEWSRKLEAQFRKKIETLSKVNHKNFVNLIGFCEEEKPFTRMMVFEYAPNGTLFEHLHIKEAERLDWKMRLRVIMGMAYCLEHMHQLNPPIPHRDLQSSSMYLSEDYATKVSDFSFWTVGTVSKMRSPSMHLLEAALTDIEGNVYNFGMVLLEIITGRMPYMEDNRTVADWVFYCLEKDYLPQDIIDPTLSSFKAEEVQRLFWIIKDCVQPDPQERPTMKTIAARLREITGMGPDGATPRLSPLWWAELEVMSMDGS